MSSSFQSIPGRCYASVSDIEFHPSPPKLSLFFYLLRTGILVAPDTGLTVGDFICKKLGISMEYVEREIQTVFLNGKPVDNVNAVVVEAGSILALSAAMPGMVGATMRSSGYYATFRKLISYDEAEGSKNKSETPVIVKCFNKVAGDLGPGLLENGITIPGETFRDFLDVRFEGFQKDLEAITLDDKPVEPNDLRQVVWGGKTVLLWVATDRKP